MFNLCTNTSAASAAAPPAASAAAPPPPPYTERSVRPEASPDTSSVGLRQQGNAKYASAFGKITTHRAPVLRIGDAKAALRLYQLATNNACDALEWVSAQKNMGMTALRLSEMKAYQERADPLEVHAQFHTSVLSLTAAFGNGNKAGKSIRWHDELELHLHNAVNGLVAYLIDAYSGHSKRYSVMRKTAMMLPRDAGPSAALVWRACANEFFKHAVERDELGDWQGCMNCLCEMYEPLEHMRLSLQSTDDFFCLTEDMHEIEQSRGALLAKARSSQHLYVAQEAQQNLLFVEEELDMDLLWFVMDEYKAAIRPSADDEAEGADGKLETEAIALSALGVLYQKILKVPETAKSLFEAAIRIAMAISQTTGSNFHAREWYKDAVDGLETIRQEKLAFDLKEVQEQRSPTLEILKPDLDAITAAIKTSSAKRPQALKLLRHIYEKHPPKIEGAELKPGLDYENNAEMKKALLKATTHYHPDKQINKTSGLEWYIMCEEIMKLINEYHSYFKERGE